MSCGACAARIKRRLNKLDGVDATVNYATGRAYFASLGGREPGELIGVIESVGYAATGPPRTQWTRVSPTPKPGRSAARWPCACRWPWP